MAKGIYSNWDRLGDISAAAPCFETIKKQVTRSMQTNYQGTSHSTPNTHPLVWRIADKVQELQLHQHIPSRSSQVPAKLVPDLRALGREKFGSASLATFNKKLRDLIAGKTIPTEGDDLPPTDLCIDSDLDGGEDSMGPILD